MDINTLTFEWIPANKALAIGNPQVFYLYNGAPANGFPKFNTYQITGLDTVSFYLNGNQVASLKIPSC